jgi:hypothetical protein
MCNRLVLLLTSGALLAILSGAVAADHVDLGVNIGVPVAPAPVVVAPAPVYYPQYAPPPPGVVEVGPPPGYYAPGPGFVWINGHWGGGRFHRGHWRRR